MIGRIHSIESLGLRDGPGIRSVVFFQGCSLRCLYCHNPDTWDLCKGKEITAKELSEKISRYKPYFNKSRGGVTCSGGEPLLQPEFLISFLKLCKEKGIHTAIDTAGFGKGKYKDILKYTDLVILDVKHISEEGYLKVTGRDIHEFKAFTDSLMEANTDIWIRHVVVPGITDSEEHILKLKDMTSQFNNLKKVELLPYHTLGVSKYKELDISYKLDGIEPMGDEKIKNLEKLLAS